jgi:hypothetical protein
MDAGKVKRRTSPLIAEMREIRRGEEGLHH